MPELYLDVTDRNRIVDFIAAHVPFAPAAAQKRLEKLLRDAETDEAAVPVHALADAARKLAIAVWPARYAVAAYGAAHPDAVWGAVASSLRSHTRVHIERLRRAFKEDSVEALLERSDADAALSDDERLELQSALAEAQVTVWKMHRTEMKDAVENASGALSRFLERMEALRELGGNLDVGLQREAFSKADHYEDRMLYEGELVPLEILDEEIAYYRDQKEISPTEG